MCLGATMADENKGQVRMRGHPEPRQEFLNPLFSEEPKAKNHSPTCGVGGAYPLAEKLKRVLSTRTQ